MTLDAMQAELRACYIGGGPGAIVSGIVWLIAAVISLQSGLSAGYMALFIGGFFIFPVGVVLVRGLMKRPTESKENRGSRVVIETLPAMIAILLFGFLLLDIQPNWAFPLAAIAVGAHYFPFRTAYGLMTYWLLGAVMMAVGGVGLVYATTIDPVVIPFVIAFVEIAFGLWLTARYRRISAA